MNRQTLKILYLLGALVWGCITLGTLLLAPPTLSFPPQTQTLTKTISGIYKGRGPSSHGIFGDTTISLIEIEYAFKLQYPDTVEKGSTILVQVIFFINETTTLKVISFNAFRIGIEPEYRIEKYQSNLEGQLKDKVLRAFESGKVRLHLNVTGAEISPPQLKFFSEKNPSAWSVRFPKKVWSLQITERSGRCGLPCSGAR
jgi:hypothetical protein